MEPIQLNWDSFVGPMEGDLLLLAVGNEALICGVQGGEMLVGRVREKIFVVRVKVNEGKAETRERAIEMAEQVAGSLF